MATELAISVKPLDVARRIEGGHPVSVPPCAAENDAGFMEGRVPAPGPKKGFIASGVRTGRTAHVRAACNGKRRLKHASMSKNFERNFSRALMLTV